MKILVVDDEPLNLHIVELALADEYDVITAADGFNAIRAVKYENPDLVLLDVMMPNFSGFETCQAIKADSSFSDLPIIFVTAMDRGEGEAQGFELGAVDYIMKPFDVNLLKLRVANHIRLKQQRDLLESQKSELQSQLDRIKRLEGIITICMYCKKIHNEEQVWQQMEQYISEHSDAMFSHGICPHCFEEQFRKLK